MSPGPDPIRAIADAVLYEGYVLWPYRRSALKNQQRFTFGGVYPPAHSEVHPDDPARRRTEALLRGDASTHVTVTVRFLQVVRRTVARRDGDRLVEVDGLTVAGERHLSWEEATEREFGLEPTPLGALETEAWVAITVAAETSHEELADHAGAIIRRWHALRGELTVSATRLGGDVWRITATVRNDTPFEGGTRPEALAHTFCSTHTLLHADGGHWVSLTDPPAQLADAAAACENAGTWPVLVGESGDDTALLSSPIILEDHPRIAPESPGDLFDGGEIDGLLVLNILALTDAEKAEMAASDPRAREILARTEALTPSQLMALHGTVREVGLTRP